MERHKLRRKGEPFTKCGKALHYSGGIGVDSWIATTCKHCLKHKPCKHCLKHKEA